MARSAANRKNEEAAEDVARGQGKGTHIFLGRWKKRARARQEQLAEQLRHASLTPQRIQKIQTWINNLESRRLWLEARLEHAKAVEDILRRAVEPRPGSDRVRE